MDDTAVAQPDASSTVGPNPFSRGDSGQATMANSLPVVVASDQSVLPTVNNSAAGLAVVLSTPPAALTASADTALTFTSQVRHIELQNNSAVSIGVELDATASAGSWQVPAGSTFLRDALCTVVHVYSTAATPVNGSAASNIVLRGRS